MYVMPGFYTLPVTYRLQELPGSNPFHGRITEPTVTLEFKIQPERRGRWTPVS